MGGRQEARGGGAGGGSLLARVSIAYIVYTHASGESVNGLGRFTIILLAHPLACHPPRGLLCGSGQALEGVGDSTTTNQGRRVCTRIRATGHHPCHLVYTFCHEHPQTGCFSCPRPPGLSRPHPITEFSVITGRNQPTQQPYNSQ